MSTRIELPADELASVLDRVHSRLAKDAPYPDLFHPELPESALREIRPRNYHAAEADRLVYGLMTHPEVIAENREVLSDVLTEERLKRIEHSAGFLRQAVAANPNSKLGRAVATIRKEVDLSSKEAIAQLAERWKRVFDNAFTLAGPEPVVGSKSFGSRWVGAPHPILGEGTPDIAQVVREDISNRGEYVRTTAISPDKRLMAIGSVTDTPSDTRGGSGGNGSVYLIDLGTGRLVFRMEVGQEATDISFTPDGREILVSGRTGFSGASTSKRIKIQ